MNEVKLVPARPLGDRILIQPDKAQESISLLDEKGQKKELHLTEGAREKPYTGTVVRVGDGDLGALGKKEMSLKIGDKIFYSKYSGTEMVIDGVTYLILKETEAFCVLE